MLKINDLPVAEFSSDRDPPTNRQALPPELGNDCPAGKE
jgi:hypothetical protein